MKFFGVPSKIVGFVTASFFVLMQIYLSFFLFKTNWDKCLKILVGLVFLDIVEIFLS